VKKLRGEIFNVTSYNERKSSILKSVQNYLKVNKPIEFGPGKDFMTANFAFNIKMSSQKLKILTGWSPKQVPVSDGIEIYYPAWKANSTQ
jgi:nucleoside-diphosphate-sugar epimerase